MPRVLVDDKVVQFNIDTVSTHARRHDPHQESPGLRVHPQGTEDPGRHHARNDEEEATGGAQRREGGLDHQALPLLLGSAHEP